MYSKPLLQRFGTVRELTQLGFSQDCDGGIFGIGATDGDWLFCHEDRSRS
jgi:biotin synthase-like enzyme